MPLVSDLHLVHKYMYVYTGYINISYCGLNENAPHKNRFLRTWSQLVALFGKLGRSGLAGEECHWGWALKPLVILSPFSLLPAKV